MAMEAQLRRRISELQSQIESLRLQNESFRNNMTRQMNEKFANMKNEYERALVRQKNETEELYATRIRSFQEEIIREMRQQYKALEEEAVRVSSLQGKKLKELSDCNEELRTILQRMKTHSEMVNDNHRLCAVDLLEELQMYRQAVQATPHEFFFQGEFDIIDSHVGQIDEEIRQEMYQAAASDASSVMMEFDLLKTKVGQALDEWIIAFQDYSRIIKMIVDKINILEQHEIKTVAGSFRMAPQEIDFWSCGTYLSFKNKVREAFALVQEIERIGIEHYLKTESKDARKGIFAKVTEAQRWDDELIGITNCVLSERILSDERWKLARDVDLQLARVGYKIVKKQFRAPDMGLKSKDWYPKGKKFNQNPMDSYDLVETIQGLDLVNITFVPVRQNGVAVRNECIVSLTAKTLTDAALGNEIIKTNVDRVRECNRNMNVSGIAISTNQKTILDSEENRRKKEPDPRRQIQFIEKKYH